MSELNVELTFKNDMPSPTDTENNNMLHQSDNSEKDETSSEISVASSTSTKLSGIRPPSRIGRPCGGIHKPAIPPTPTRIGSTASSMEGLWELHPRRLSEAGLSRHSDSSAILTEDTDSFIIGQRVWVGGTKSGTIAFIGETQFAPGEWAGIALDEPIGKNDGSVSGTRYFQCESKKGIFSRLTRLTRVPLEQPGMGSNETFSSPTNGTRGSPMSPTGSFSPSFLKSPKSLSNSNTSLASTATHVDFKLGDRVIIKSTQGSKVGTVKFIGLTDFAPGEWVGVELDDPRGKNDGSVEGKRYFECRPNFGLFAPISKVSKSPSKHKPGACVVHSGVGLPPSGLKRTNSKESMTSMTSRTSTASGVRRVRLGVTSLTPKKVSSKTTPTASSFSTRTGLQDVLKEKQQHIEQLLKERDLERAEITRAASQADEAEHRFFTLKAEFEQYRAECESKVKSNADLLDRLKVDRTELLNQLEEEKRKNEDLQFKFEEAAISNTDNEATSETYANKIQELQQQLEEERKKILALENVSDNLFEAEENLIKARDDSERLRNELEEFKKTSALLEKEKLSSLALIETLKEKMHITKVDNDEKDSIIDKLHQELSQLNEIREKTKREIVESQYKLDQSCKEKDNEFEKLRCTSEQKDKELEEKLIIITELNQNKENLLKENDKLKMELSSKSFDLETTSEKMLTLENQLKAVTEELNNAKVTLSEKDATLKQCHEQQEAVVEKLNKELNETKENLETKLKEIADLTKKNEAEIKLKDQQIDEAKETVTRHKREVENLNIQLADTRCSAEKKEIELSNIHSTQIESQDLQLKALSTDVQVKYEELVKLRLVVNKLEEDLCIKNTIIKKCGLEKQEIENQNVAYKQELSQMQQQLNDLTLNFGDIQRQLTASLDRIALLQEVKQRQELEIAALTTRCENPEQLQQLRAELNIKEQALESLRIEFEQKMQLLERSYHELELEHELTIKNWNKQQEELMTQAKTSANTNIELRAQIDRYTEELSKIRDQSQTVIANLEQLVNEKTLLLENFEIKYTQNEKLQETQLSALREELNRNIQNNQEKIITLTNENAALRNEINVKSEQVIELNTKCNQRITEATQYETNQKQSFNEVINKLQLEINQKSAQIDSLNLQLQTIREDSRQVIDNLQEKLVSSEQLHKTELINLKEELGGSVNNYEERINTLNEENIHFKEALQEKSNQIVELNSRCVQLQANVQQTQAEQKQNFDQTIYSLQFEINEKKLQIDKLIAELQQVRETYQTTNNVVQAKDQQINELTVQNQSTRTLIAQLEEELAQVKHLSDQKYREQASTQTQYMETLNQVSVLEQKLQDSEICKQNLQNERNNAIQLMSYLSVTQNQKKQCMQQLANDSRHCEYVQELFEKMNVNVDQNEEKVLILEKEVENRKNEIGECNRAFERQKNEVIRLQQILSQAQQDEARTLPVNSDQLEKQTAESQINFLNSIIVDMQRKNQEQKARIEILESGYSASIVDDLNLMDHKQKQPIPPRLYCDICEEFDLHDTDDCPTQDSDLQHVNMRTKQKRDVPERAYCEVCETFGHATEDCQEDGTF